MKRFLSSLKKSDLFYHLVWEHWYENNIEYVKKAESKEISETNESDYIVRTSFTLNNGFELNGFCSPKDPSGLDYIQPIILTDNEPVKFWNDLGWKPEDKDKELQKLELKWSEVFPIKYETLIKCDGRFYQGIITDFNEGI